MEKILIVTSSAGGGHITASLALEDKIKRTKSKDVEFVKKDLLKDWLPKWLGLFKTGLWNLAQSKGSIRALKWMGNQQASIDFLLWPYVFFRAFFCLRREKPSQFFDTQPLSSSTLLKALRLYNYFYGKNLCLEKVITDLPTKKAEHFFQRIRRLSVKDASFIRLITTKPLLEKGETLEGFWLERANLPLSQISIGPPILREGFLDYVGKTSREKNVEIAFSCKNLEEIAFFAGCDYVEMQQEGFSINLGSEDLLFTVLLGARPPSSALVEYLEGFLQFFQKTYKGSVYIVLCCSRKKKLQKELFSFQKKASKNVKILPVSKQKCSTIAALLHYSQINITKSGGQTAMELLGVATGDIWIHSESDQINSEKKLLEGMALWESDNARYLMKEKGAKIVTPKLTLPYLKTFFSNSTASSK